MRNVALLSVLSIVAGCCTEQAYKTPDFIHAELRPEQLPEEAFTTKDGQTVPLEGLQYESVLLLRGPAVGAQAPLVATRGLHQVGSQSKATADVAFEFHDGRVWLGFPGGGKVPYVDAEGRVFLLDREQLFDMPEGVDLADPERRVPLEKIVNEPERFEPLP